MSVKNKVLAAAASLTLVGGAGVAALATAGTANAATPSCGSGCVDVYSAQFGNQANPQFVMDSFKQGDVAGTPIILFRVSNADPAEDFTVDQEGAVSEFLAAGLVSSALALHYGCTTAVFGPDACVNAVPGGNGQGNHGTGADYEAFEYMYSPFGVQTGLCVGVGAAAVTGTKVTLQPCGLSGKTIWISTIPSSLEVTGTSPSPSHSFQWNGTLQPLINGSGVNFSQPESLTYPNSSYPTDTPRPELYTSNLLGFSQSTSPGDPDLGSVNSNQLWSYVPGVLP